MNRSRTIEQINTLSAELAQRDIHIPPEVMLDHVLETCADLAITVYHVHWGHRANGGRA